MYIHKSMKKNFPFRLYTQMIGTYLPYPCTQKERVRRRWLCFFFFLQPQHDSFWRSCERLRVFKNRFDGTNESTFSTYVQVTKKRMNDEKLNRQQECAYNNDIKCLLIILIYLILQVREPFKTDEDFQSALVCIFSNTKQYDFRWKTQTNNIYNDIYGARSTAIYVFQQIRLAQSKFSKAKKKDLDTQLVIVNLGSTKNLEVLVYVQGNKSDKINVQT